MQKKLTILLYCFSAAVIGYTQDVAVFPQLGHSYGVNYYPLIFSSSRGNKTSQEKPEYKHGLFTYSIIKGMEGEAVTRSGATVTIKSLDSYVSDIVSELSNGRQNPITNAPNGYDNFILARTRKK